MQSNILETYYLGISVDMVKLCWIIVNSVQFQLQIGKDRRAGQAVNRQSCGLSIYGLVRVVGMANYIQQGLAAGITEAPVVAIFGIIYGVYRLTAGSNGDALIDQYFGYR